MNNENLLSQLESGLLRAAYLEDGEWIVDQLVKESILQLFKTGVNINMPGGFVDKDSIPTRQVTVEDQFRFVPGGSSIRRGAYVAPKVIVMPPSYINIGAYVDEGTMVDSHVLVGSCAQIGKRVHLSAAVQIGGVLEPIGMRPVIIEDDVFVGAGCSVVEGILVKKKAVLAPGVILSKSIPVFDVVNQVELPRGSSIPENAVVVPGSRNLTNSTPWTEKLGLKCQCALIIKYRDEKSQQSLNLENLLR